MISSIHSSNTGLLFLDLIFTSCTCTGIVEKYTVKEICGCENSLDLYYSNLKYVFVQIFKYQNIQIFKGQKNTLLKIVFR